MTPVTIYHNPRCSKSRETLTLLRENGVEPEIVLYLETPPDAAALKGVLEKLGFTSARALMRTKEPLYRSLELGNTSLSEEKLLAAMAAHPALIERPIVIAGNQARLGRPPEQVLEIVI